MTEEKSFPATAMPNRDWWAALWPDPEAVLRALGVRAGMIALDLCCGDGYFTAPLARIVGGRVYALDIDPLLLERARCEVERHGVSMPVWICGDARDLDSLVDQRVDFVLMANTFHGVPDQTGLARAVANILEPGGFFAIVNWSPIPKEQTPVLGAPRGPTTALRMSPEQVRGVVEPAGFELADLVELPPYHYGAVFRRRDGADRTNASGVASGV